MNKTTILGFVLFLLLKSATASATLIDFESLPDLSSVTNQYASQGVTFANTISLTSGFSLNEFSYPPHSGQVVVGDDNAPIEMMFTNPANNISAWFTYSDSLTITAYDSSNVALGNLSLSGSNLGFSDQVSLAFNNVARLVVAGNTNNTLTMDDLSFTESSAPVPEPMTLLLMGGGLFGVVIMKKRS